MTNTDYTKWKTQDGRIIDVKDMDISHIENTITMLGDKGFVSAETVRFYLTCLEPNGEGAQFALERERNFFFSKTPSRWIDVLETEIKRRNNER